MLFVISSFWLQWARIQRLLEDRLEKVQDLRFGQAQMQAAHHQALENGKLEAFAQQQRLMEQQGQHRMQVGLAGFDRQVTRAPTFARNCSAPTGHRRCLDMGHLLPVTCLEPGLLGSRHLYSTLGCCFFY